jgi:hypothetical protein
MAEYRICFLMTIGSLCPLLSTFEPISIALENTPNHFSYIIEARCKRKAVDINMHCIQSESQQEMEFTPVQS